ncbi:MAG: hypothetical protein IKQ11_07500 [Paludibacteraceae bacterium]|nr:hypothetical protein [Paludibacteraceae bacterium]
MISVEHASAIYAKLCAGERITATEKEELDEYAERFKSKNVGSGVPSDAA